ncbi:MAG: 6-bladed beta-propeller [Candidatus Marinimicrobia bacterium]|nr:6-bladed beta-propeller [Candidatus Neomarinimicrobiota bacterium]MBT4294418.1 6-bladed beta-propeller [Candidatus Neomarinimicrobiota bacterium]MBT5315522.1 6-bladed beta-propeller [Candidatus Neomarinimicrobiota bacterium]MBT5467646.1 6-bladed beta-propeller [Candidatus Neomarinimicrobiota bacterium]MBT6001273.1 6-bladed beta-propeller [Candidatus Neomarinimicrobiota bacterium]
MIVIRSFKPSQISLFLVIAVIMTGLVGCASTRQTTETINFPADIPQPFLSLEQVIEGAQDTPEGLFSRFLGMIVGQESKFSLNQPTDMAIDQRGRLLIVESEAGVISIFIKEEGEWLNSERISLAEIKYPTSIAAGADKIFINDLNNGSVHILDYDFNLVGTMDHADMQRPGGLSYDSHSNRLLIADPPANVVFVFSTEGEYIGQLGRGSHTQGVLQSPIATTVDPENGNIYVLDGMARKVKQYDASFQFVSSFGEYDQVPGSFAFPKGIALAVDGTLFVGDAAFGNIQMFDPTGALLFYFGETGTDKGQFLMPRSLFIDQEQHLFVADPYNNRVQIFRYYAQ